MVNLQAKCDHSNCPIIIIRRKEDTEGESLFKFEETTTVD